MKTKLTTLVAAIALFATACTHGSKTHAAAEGAQLGQRVTLHGNELHYGESVRPTPGIVYQPNVVIIGDGADAVRSVSSDGLVWTIDAGAPGASDLAVGKIMLATTFGAGRVLKLTRSGDTDQVVLGPVTITDVIRDGELRSSAPVPLSDALVYTTPGQPSVAPAPSQHTTQSTAERPLTPASQAAGFANSSQALPSVPTGQLPVPTHGSGTVSASDFRLSPFFDGNDGGVHIGYSKNGARLQATFGMHFIAPYATFVIKVDNGGLDEASVQLHGGVSIKLAFAAATMETADLPGGTTVAIPATIAFPLNFGLPLTLTLTQTFYMSLQLEGRASLSTHGEYRLTGTIGFGYRAGHPFASSLSSGLIDPMTAHTMSLSVGTNAITVAWGLKIGVGVGALGFEASAWYELYFSASLVAAPTEDVLNPGCVKDSIYIGGRYGIGWRVPQVVVAVVNAFFSLLGVNPIAAQGGDEWDAGVIWRPRPGNYCR